VDALGRALALPLSAGYLPFTPFHSSGLRTREQSSVPQSRSALFPQLSSSLLKTLRFFLCTAPSETNLFDWPAVS